MLEEAPFDVPGALHRAARLAEAILLDCVGIWLSNLMERGLSDAHILLHARETAHFLEHPPVFTVAVAQEVGLGVAPASRLGNRFRDLNGEVNQILAQSCREVIFVACGLPITLKADTGEHA
jgi:adenosylcobinamide kinase/adenosylcobinamide-phosphate guanylyltransferase